MLKSFWPLWLLAGALCLCLLAVAYLHYQVQAGAETIGSLQSANEANTKVLQGLQDTQEKQEKTLLNWNARQQNLTKAARSKAKTVREVGKNEAFKLWADQPLPVDTLRVLQSADSAP